MTSFYHSTTLDKLASLRTYVSKGYGNAWITLSMHDQQYNNQSITLSKQDTERLVLLLQATLRETDEMGESGTTALRMDVTGDNPETIETETRPDYLPEVDDESAESAEAH